ncbi:P-loop NTPase fold protein [Streptomyces sp. FXJ1.172]|uniref:KAP family P-loop NTPase fold protein n=1 Tax=Streptomyces sp. FXJ1.172 TaxID=710705 RepID=UPI0007CFDD75|nr:P-loop NTPase fold protein [Streptomyces sp. FXJ1.172]WEO99459.1 P-loop NTPase fold protein [Streptomyces sp. FXJ1.172]
MRPLTDNPVTSPQDDSFHFGPYVDVLHEAVEQATPLPLTVGVFGSWGAGKSSFLRLWERRFEAGNAKTIWFNPWKYDRKVEVWAALLHTILAEMEQVETLKDRAVKLAKAATWLSVRAGLGTAAALGTGGVIKREDVDKLLTGLSEGDAEQYRQVNHFEADFADAVREFVGEGGRLVVFVDDLDRCTPESAMTVLESLKLFLAQSQCVFVLALDVDVLAAIATNKFGQALKGAPAEVASGMAYLEKIVQLPFFLPDVGFDTLREAFRPYVSDLSEDDFFWELLRRGLGGNPRRLKRYINVFNMALAVSRAQMKGQMSREFRLQLAVLLIIRTLHRGFYHTLTTEPEAWMLLTRWFEQVQTNPATRQNYHMQVPEYLHGFVAEPVLERLLTHGGPERLIPPDGKAVQQMITTLRSTAGPADPE